VSEDSNLSKVSKSLGAPKPPVKSSEALSVLRLMDRYTVLKRTTPNGDEAWFVWDTEERKRMSGDYALWRAAHIEKMRCYAGRLETVRDDFAQRVRRALPIEEEMLAGRLMDRIRVIFSSACVRCTGETPLDRARPPSWMRPPRKA